MSTQDNQAATQQTTQPATQPATPQNNPKTMTAWAMYDWANSSYALVINTALFPLYFQGVMGNDARTLRVAGYDISANAAYSYSLTLSFLILVFLSPVLSSIAGSRGNKLSFLKFFCTLGALSTMGLFFFKSASDVGLALLLNISASIGFYGSLVFYNAFLPEVASHDKQDALSAKGFALGYLGSLLMLMLALYLVQEVADDSHRGFYTRLCFLITGFWWWGFAQFSFSRLPTNRILSLTEQTHHAQKTVWTLFWDAYSELRNTMRDLMQSKRIKWLLTSFFFYSVGMQTIFFIATFIGKEIHLSDAKMILTIMLLQVEAIIGALSFAWLVKKIGNTTGLILAVVIWIVICLMIYRLAGLGRHSDVNLETQFFITAGLVGLVMGGLQSVSRSTYSKLLPISHDSSTFFSFYDVLEKCAIVVGTLVHATLINRTGNTQASALALALFFVVGLLCLVRLRMYERKLGP